MTTLALIVVLSLAVAWLTAAATALSTVSQIWLRHWAERRLSGVDASELSVERPRRMLFAAGTGTAGLVFAMGALVSLREDGRLLVQDLLLAVLMVLVIGQMLPRAIARRWAGGLAPVLLPVLRALDWLVTPLLDFASKLVRPVTARVRAEVGGAPDPLGDLLRAGELEGVGEASERAIISGVAEFDEKRAGDVMTPRREIVAVERGAPAADIIRAAAQSKYSRIPVYDRDLDHVAGLVHSFDLLAYPEAPVTAIRPVTFAGVDAPCHDLMRAMLRDRRHLAIIQGTGGETAGLVTLEDLLEELVGDISDEHDHPGGEMKTA